MKNMRFAARIIAGALASAVILTGSLAAPAQAAKPDTSTKGGGDSTVQSSKDTGWNGV
jgi:hypothetical protein